MEYANASEEQKIENLDNFICSGGNDMIEYYNNYIRFNKSDKKVMTLKEYVKLLNEDDHFKIILTCANQKTLKKIHFWILFWSIWAIIGVIITFIYLLTHYELFL
jgi:hypothetical protein